MSAVVCYRLLCFALLLNEPCFPAVWRLPFCFCVFDRLFFSLPLVLPPGYTFAFPTGLPGESPSACPSCWCLHQREGCQNMLLILWTTALVVTDSCSRVHVQCVVSQSIWHS